MLSTSRQFLRISLFFNIITFSVCDSFGQVTDSVKSEKPSIIQHAVNSAQLHFSFWDSLPKPIGWVNDFEGLYTTEEVQKLDSIINSFHQQSTIEITIVTLDTSATPKDRFEELTLRLVNAWGVGKKAKNNGMLIGISKGFRKMRIENGYGIELLMSDLTTKNIIDNDFIPAFKRGNYFEGTLNGLDAIIAALKMHQ